MRTERGMSDSGWRVALRGFLAVVLLVVTTATLWHEHSAAHALDQDATSCVTCHAAHGFGNALASTQAAWTAPRAAAPAPCAAIRVPLPRRHKQHSARGPPVLA